MTQCKKRKISFSSRSTQNINAIYLVVIFCKREFFESQKLPIDQLLKPGAIPLGAPVYAIDPTRLS